MGCGRAKDKARAAKRHRFLDDLIDILPVYPVTTELARMAGRIDAERQQNGIRIALQDLLIGVAALHLGYAVATHNIRHFEMIPDLAVKRI